ncbi:hypothetical protein CYMTET_55235 [Cymbomonas tetramitiformis]|uniref:Uncharacterized protein n=1 Tax=Cymbomonas tetramitiformis TaxID=36881 RepID=A0AAE0EQ32_9CHLO|nr:hypothetical protein CYMTET_55235 [Cymbomonas tetramitiformis]|eukprot:gene3507-4410_t
MVTVPTIAPRSLYQSGWNLDGMMTGIVNEFQLTAPTPIDTNDGSSITYDFLEKVYTVRVDTNDPGMQAALTTDGEVWGRGRNMGRVLNTQLGGWTVGPWTKINVPSGEVIIGMAMSERSGLFWTANNRLFGLGFNVYGQLGLGSNSEESNTEDYEYGYNDWENTNFIASAPALTEVLVTEFLQETEKIVGASIEKYHALLWTDAGRMYATGRNYGGSRCDIRLEEYVAKFDLCTKVPEGDYIVQAIAGHLQTVYVTSDHRVKFSGWNKNNKFCNGQNVNSLRTSSDHNYEIIPVLPDKSISKVSMSWSHVIYLETGGDAYECGQLGVTYEEEFASRSVDKSEMGKDSEIVDVFAGLYRSYYRTKNNFFGMGGNIVGQLDVYSPREIKIPNRKIVEAISANGFTIFSTEKASITSGRRL